MEAPSQFYLTLPSSNDEIIYPSNRATHFSTVLSPIIDFMNEKYEVALVEFHLRGIMYNFETPMRMLVVDTPTTKESYMYFSEHRKVEKYHAKEAFRINLKESDEVTMVFEKVEDDQYRCRRTIYLKPGLYKSFKDIIRQLSSTLSRTLEMTLGISETNKRNKKKRTLNLYLTSRSKDLYSYYTISVSPYFASSYCTETENFPFQEEYVIFTKDKSSHEIKFDAEMLLPKPSNHEIILYSNICDFTYFGSHKLQILRACKFPLENGMYDHVIIYDTPHYVPVIGNRIQEIEVELRDLEGKFFPILEGHTIIKLHFRKIENN